MVVKILSWQTMLDFGWLIFLLFVFRQCWISRQYTHQTQRWHKTMGHITKCEWKICQHVLWPTIEYVYQVGDKDFTNDHICRDTLHQSPTSAHMRRLAYQIANAFQHNQNLDVYYDPNHPEQSVLDTTIPRKLQMIVFVLGILIGVQVTLMTLKLLH